MSWISYRQEKIASYKRALADGKVDKRIIALLNKINENPDLATLSSCSGRINLLEFDIKKGKPSASFFAKWHEPVDNEEFERRLNSYTGKVPLWFKVEPFILHVAAKDAKSATRFVRSMRANGVKRGGMQGISKDRIPIEVGGTGRVAFPIDLIECEWNDMITLANAMLKKNLSHLKRLEKVKW